LVKEGGIDRPKNIPAWHDLVFPRAAHVISKAELNFLGREWWNSHRMLK
jgi:hypothetical protein